MADGSVTIDTKLDNDGFKKGLGSLEGVASKFGAGLKTVFAAGTAAIATTTAGLAALTKAAVTSYASLEQNIGGIETLFEDLADDVEDNAKKAYKTAGLSANEYYETAMSFAASLNQSLVRTDGNIRRSAELTDMAIVDMSDNANKMGTSMESIRTAYAGFAKQNYTLLDNLKLGYGGTKAEMERLLKDAEKISGVKYDISNLSDVYQAIHVIQGELGITGTTAKEAEATISGSIASLKASWDNFLNGSGDLGAVMDNVQNVIQNVITAAGKLMPQIIDSLVKGIPDIVKTAKEIITKLKEGFVKNSKQILEAAKTIIQTLVEGMTEVLPDLAPVLVGMIADIGMMLLDQLPLIIDCGIKIIIGLIEGITEAIPRLLEMLPDILQRLVDTIVQNLPLLVEAGIKLLKALAQGIVDFLPKFLEMAPKLIEELANSILDNLPQLIEAGMQIIMTLVGALIDNLPQIVMFAPKIIITLIKTIIEHLPEILATGARMIGEMISGIGSKIGEIGEKAKEIGETVRDKIKEFFDKAFNWGKDMVDGLVRGIKSKLGLVSDTATSVADSVSKVIHFSRPDEGPLRDYETWMPDMVKGLATTLRQASPLLEKEAQLMASKLQMAVDMQQAKFALGATTNREINIDVNVTGGDMYFDTDRVGQILAPSVSNTIRAGGTY